jgi:hypothetical protein
MAPLRRTPGSLETLKQELEKKMEARPANQSGQALVRAADVGRPRISGPEGSSMIRRGDVD